MIRSQIFHTMPLYHAQDISIFYKTYDAIQATWKHCYKGDAVHDVLALLMSKG